MAPRPPAWAIEGTAHAQPARGPRVLGQGPLETRPDAAILRAVAERPSASAAPYALRVRVLTGPVAVGESFHSLPYITPSTARPTVGGFVVLVPWTHSTNTLRVDVVLDMVPMPVHSIRTHNGPGPQVALRDGRPPQQADAGRPTAAAYATAVVNLVDRAVNLDEDASSSWDSEASLAARAEPAQGS